MKKKLTPKQRVLKKYPNAHCVRPTKSFFWIHRNAWKNAPNLDGRMLGSGSSAASAWASAARSHA